MDSRLGGSAPDTRPALVVGDDAPWSYGRLRAETDRVADLLAAQGLRFGDHIAVLFDNDADLFPVVWAAQRTGLYYTPVNWHLTAEEASYIVSDCGARVLVASVAHRELTARICADVAAVTSIDIGEAEPAEPSETAGSKRLPQAWEGFAMFYSSGTTGQPKGILRAPVRTPVGTAGPIDLLMREMYGLSSDAVYLSTGPLYHAAPLGWCVATQRLGGTAVVMERFDALRALELIERHRVTHVQFVPTMMSRLLRLSQQDRDRYDLSSLQVVVHAAAPCPVEVKRDIIDWFGPIVWEYYAGSEGNGYFAIDSSTWCEHPGSVGQARYGTAHILDDEGHELPSGTVGTVWFEGTGAFSYHNDPDKTAQAFNAQGWSTLGDVGSLDDDGFLFLSDRRVDLIISGGVNVYPQEVENALARHPAVFDAAVIGVPDTDMGERVLAVVQVEDGYEPDDELVRDLLEHCGEVLARFKCPRELVFAAELPRLPSGKLLRRRVREEYGRSTAADAGTVPTPRGSYASGGTEAAVSTNAR